MIPIIQGQLFCSLHWVRKTFLVILLHWYQQRCRQHIASNSGIPACLHPPCFPVQVVEDWFDPCRGRFGERPSHRRTSLSGLRGSGSLCSPKEDLQAWTCRRVKISHGLMRLVMLPYTRVVPKVMPHQALANGDCFCAEGFSDASLLLTRVREGGCFLRLSRRQYLQQRVEIPMLLVRRFSHYSSAISNPLGPLWAE